MAVSIAKTKAKIYENKPDQKVNVELENGEKHEWTVRNSGVLLQLELSRFAMEMRKISSLGTDGLTEKQQQEIFDEYNTALGRFESAYNTSILSEDGSAEQFYNENKADLPLVLAVVQDILEETKKA